MEADSKDAFGHLDEVISSAAMTLVFATVYAGCAGKHTGPELDGHAFC